MLTLRILSKVSKVKNHILQQNKEHNMNVLLDTEFSFEWSNFRISFGDSYEKNHLEQHDKQCHIKVALV